MASNQLEEDEIFEAEYKLQNCIRVTLDVENFKTEVNTGKRWMEVSDYVEGLLKHYISREAVEEAIGEDEKLQGHSVGGVSVEAAPYRNKFRAELRNKLLKGEGVEGWVS